MWYEIYACTSTGNIYVGYKTLLHFFSVILWQLQQVRRMGPFFRKGRPKDVSSTAQVHVALLPSSDVLGTLLSVPKPVMLPATLRLGGRLQVTGETCDPRTPLAISSIYLVSDFPGPVSATLTSCRVGKLCIWFRKPTGYEQNVDFLSALPGLLPSAPGI